MLITLFNTIEPFKTRDTTYLRSFICAGYQALNNKFWRAPISRPVHKGTGLAILKNALKLRGTKAKSKGTEAVTSMALV